MYENELQTDYIGFHLIHEPYDNVTQMYEAMKEAYQEGKIKAFGISNFDGGRSLFGWY